MLKLKYLNDYIQFNYRKFRNGKSSVSRVLGNIELLKAHEVSFEIRATITSDNPYIYETYRFFEELKILVITIIIIMMIHQIIPAIKH